MDASFGRIASSREGPETAPKPAFNCEREIGFAAQRKMVPRIEAAFERIARSLPGIPAFHRAFEAYGNFQRDFCVQMPNSVLASGEFGCMQLQVPSPEIPV
jgi:hypothetical protein